MELTSLSQASPRPTYSGTSFVAAPGTGRALSVRLSQEARERHRQQEEADAGFLFALADNFG